MRILRTTAFLAAFVLPIAAHASSLSYDFTYNGNGIFGPTTASGNGSFTFDTTTGKLTAFSFVDSLKIPSGTPSGTSVYTYQLSDVILGAATFGGTVANPTLATLAIDTGYVTGTDPAFGAVDFDLAYAAVNPGTGFTGTTGTIYGTITTGTTDVTSAPLSAVPEPSTLALLGTGALGLIGTVRRRFRRA